MILAAPRGADAGLPAKAAEWPAALDAAEIGGHVQHARQDAPEIRAKVEVIGETHGLEGGDQQSG